MRKLIAIALLVLFTAPPSLACDGTPPELVNEDDVEREYTISCGKKRSKHTIAAGASHSLEGKSGCKIKVGDGKAQKLFTEMVCTIADGQLSCELL